MRLPIFCSLFIALTAMITVHACKDKDPVCDCRSYEICVNNECQVAPNSFKIGDSYVTTDYGYYGVLKSNFCLDTILFIADPNDKFALYLNVPPAMNVGPGVYEKFDDNSFSLIHGAPLCYRDGKEWYATIYCDVFPDSVNLKFDFWDFNHVGLVTDSAKVTLYKR